MQYKPELLEKVKELYPDWTELHAFIEKSDRDMVERCLYDACACLFVDPREVIAAKTDDDVKKIKEKANEIIQKRQLYSDFVHGLFVPNVAKRQFFGCPKLYGHKTGNADVLREFKCSNVGYIPNCYWYGTDCCWNAFFKKGFSFE